MKLRYQWWFVHEGCTSADLPEISRKIKPNIWIKIFTRRYIHSLKEYE
jgi:hypothetical protein